MAIKETERQRERECWLHMKQKDREIESNGYIGSRKTERKRVMAAYETERQRDRERWLQRKQ